MIDHLHRDAAARRPRERAGGVGIKRRPRILVDIGLQCGLQALVGIVRAEEIGVADEKAFLVIVGVDEPSGDALGVVGSRIVSRFSALWAPAVRRCSIAAGKSLGGAARWAVR
jgi:hypothetical protein